MPPRITEKSCRPRVSDRTMVGNSATRLACEFQKTEWRRHDSDMKPQRGRSIDGRSLRGLWGRSATGQNGQAVANKEVSAVWSEGWMSENISGVPAGRSVFHLTSPFIGHPTRRPGRRQLLTMWVELVPTRAIGATARLDPTPTTFTSALWHHKCRAVRPVLPPTTALSSCKSSA
jgi:hypothetical protein